MECQANLSAVCLNSLQLAVTPEDPQSLAMTPQLCKQVVTKATVLQARRLEEHSLGKGAGSLKASLNPLGPAVGLEAALTREVEEQLVQIAAQGQHLDLEYLTPESVIGGPYNVQSRIVSLVRDQEAMTLANRWAGQAQLSFPGEIGPKQLTIKLYSADTMSRDFRLKMSASVGFNKAMTTALSEPGPMVAVLAKTTHHTYELEDLHLRVRCFLLQIEASYWRTHHAVVSLVPQQALSYSAHSVVLLLWTF